MSELLRSGFEEQTLTFSYWNAVNNAVVDNAIKHSGGWSLKIFPTGTTQRNVRKDLANPTTGDIYERIYIYPTAVSASVDASIVEHRSSGNVGEVLVRLMRTGVLRLENLITADTVSTSTVLLMNTWYRIEVHHQLHATTGDLELKLFLGDSTVELESTLQILDKQTINSNLGSIYYGQLTNPSSNTTYYLDDIGLNNEAGSAPFNTWVGPGKMYGFTAVSNNAIAWTPLSGSNFENVDETPGAVPDDITTYNSVVTNSVEDRFNITSPPGEVTSTAVMKSMTLWGRYSVDAANTNTFCLKIWDQAGTGTQGPTITYALTTWITTTIALHQSFDLTGKTKTDMDSFSIGYRSLTGVAAKRFSAIYGHVEWLESAGQTLAVDSGSYSSSGQVALLRLASPLYLRYRK